jgi:hypothetical protein
VGPRFAAKVAHDDVGELQGLWLDMLHRNVTNLCAEIGRRLIALLDDGYLSTWRLQTPASKPST